MRLEGDGAMTDAIGALVTVRTGKELPGRVSSRAAPATSLRTTCALHFGLGKAARVDAIEVRWPDGSTSEQAAVEVGQEIIIEKRRSAPPNKP